MQSFKFNRHNELYDTPAIELSDFCRKHCLEYAKMNSSNDKELANFILSYKGFYPYYDFLIRKLSFKTNSLIDYYSNISIKNNMFYIDGDNHRFSPFFNELKILDMNKKDIDGVGFILPSLTFVGSNVFDHSEISCALLQVILANNNEEIINFNSLDNYFRICYDYLVYRLGCIKVADYRETNTIIYNPLIINNEQKLLIQYLKELGYETNEVTYFLDSSFEIKKRLSKVKFK